MSSGLCVLRPIKCDQVAVPECRPCGDVHVDKLSSSINNRTMLLRVDPASTVSLHDQLAGQIRQLITDGELQPGEKLPPARELASGLGVNVHTMLGALQTLRAEGLLEMRRGRGTTVTATAPQQSEVTSLARAFVEEARRFGLSDATIRTTLEAQL